MIKRSSEVKIKKWKKIVLLNNRNLSYIDGPHSGFDYLNTKNALTAYYDRKKGHIFSF